MYRTANPIMMVQVHLESIDLRVKWDSNPRYFNLR